jgi:hypothetical protein
MAFIAYFNKQLNYVKKEQKQKPVNTPGCFYKSGSGQTHIFRGYIVEIKKTRVQKSGFNGYKTHQYSEPIISALSLKNL